jgi:iron complex outermembrane recepter protein
MVKFLDVRTFSNTLSEQTDISAFFRGNLFDVPAGPVASVFGAEYRENNLRFTVDNEQSQGNIYGFNAVQDRGGRIETQELYGELGIPVFKDLFLMKSFGFELGARWSDYSTIHGVWAYKAGFNWTPIEDVRIRGMWNRAVRAPSVFELFQNGDQGFPGYSDPCAGATGSLAAFCTATRGFAGPWNTFTAQNSQVQAFSFGNPNLQAETAQTYTLGIVYQPSHFPIGQPSVSVDWYDIKLKEAISARGAQTVLNSCYNSLSLANPDCSRFTADPATGQITAVDTSVVNLGQEETKGIDTQVNWALDLDTVGAKGRLSFNELLSWLDSFNVNGSEYKGADYGAIGGGHPEWKSVFSAQYEIGTGVGDFTAFARWSHTSSMRCEAFICTFPAADYVDTSLKWDLSKHFSVIGTIDNLMDKRSPEVPDATVFGQGNTDPQVYEEGILGRTFTVSAHIKI